MAPPTPVQQVGPDLWAKRDDLFSVAGVAGGKVRTCWALATAPGDVQGLVTAGSRSSPQVSIVAHIARQLGVPCRVHTPSGKAGPEVEAAIACGATRIEHRPGYNSVIVRRAADDAAALGWRLIPFGMECKEAVRLTAQQVQNLPAECQRLVVPVGSGMSLAGILHGLVSDDNPLLVLPKVLGVVVGADPTKRLDQWAPVGWRAQVQLVTSPLPYHKPAPVTSWQGLDLDPIYEAKCLPLLRPGDCLWVVGHRRLVF